MDRKDFFIMTEEEFFVKPLKVAVVAENLTVDEHKNVLDYLLTLKKEEKIEELGFKNVRGGAEQTFNIGFTLHECLLKYPRGTETNYEKQLENGNACEFIRLLPVDAVFVFDIGGTLPYEGRLWNRLKNNEKTVVYFARNKENTSWEPYRCCQFVWDEEKEEVVEDWCFIGEIEKGFPDDGEMEETDVAYYRHFSKDSMTDREYDIANRCLMINSRCLGLEIRAMVSRNEEMDAKVEKILSEQNEILFKLQTIKELKENDLKTFEAQLDFIEDEFNTLWQD